jgi:hypothetical protein
VVFGNDILPFLKYTAIRIGRNKKLIVNGGIQTDTEELIYLSKI